MAAVFGTRLQRVAAAFPRPRAVNPRRGYAAGHRSSRNGLRRCAPFSRNRGKHIVSLPADYQHYSEAPQGFLVALADPGTVARAHSRAGGRGFGSTAAAAALVGKRRFFGTLYVLTRSILCIVALQLRTGRYGTARLCEDSHRMAVQKRVSFSVSGYTFFLAA